MNKIGFIGGGNMGGALAGAAIKAVGAQNVLVVENGAIYMASADCPDKTCVLRGKIHLSGESIVCLPHKISVVIRGAGDGPDLVS